MCAKMCFSVKGRRIKEDGSQVASPGLPIHSHASVVITFLKSLEKPFIDLVCLIWGFHILLHNHTMVMRIVGVAAVQSCLDQIRHAAYIIHVQRIHRIPCMLYTGRPYTMRLALQLIIDIDKL